MPLYNYKCTVCSNEFELIVSIPDPDVPQPCTKCGKPATFTMPLGSRNGVAFRFNYMAPDA